MKNMPKQMVITLLTDFGLQDGYVASLKGVILGICSQVILVDISHAVQPQDIRAGAFLLYTVYRDFPQNTIHMAVVDPGVGTDRRGLAIQTSSHCFVGPDNGLFSWILKAEKNWKAVSLDKPRYWRPRVSPTFHGRDIFAPVAAHLAQGIPLELLGSPCHPLPADWTALQKSIEGLHGEVVYVDHFGNCITNITSEDLESFAGRELCYVKVAGRTIGGISQTYGQKEHGEPLALVGSSNHLEIAVNRAHASRLMGIQPGETVLITMRNRSEGCQLYFENNCD
jgi:S-adenosylmethionine hydrolase